MAARDVMAYDLQACGIEDPYEIISPVPSEEARDRTART
jgi:hypothetical protein